MTFKTKSPAIVINKDRAPVIFSIFNIKSVIVS